jgi:DHA2 family multidrug resistance protein
MLMSLMAMPLVLLLRKPKVAQEVDHTIAME